MRAKSSSKPELQRHARSENIGDIVAGLARKLNLPLEEVEIVYRDQLARLESQARVRNFIGTLARRNTLRCLRDRHRGEHSQRTGKEQASRTH
jgi:hypothetical protein